MIPLAADEAAELLALGTATLYEASGLDCLLPARLRPVWSGAVLAGRALPVQTPAGDNLPLHVAIELAQPGDVLLVDAAGAEFGYWGEVMTVAALHRGIAGLVIDGGVRDVDRLAELRFPVFSSCVALRGTVKASTGAVGQPLAFGDVLVQPGDAVVADADGVIVVPAAEHAAVLASARRRSTAEQGYLQRLRSGESTMDVYELRSRLQPAER